MLEALKREVSSLGDPKRVQTNARFFKTGRGQYGEEDTFVGLTVPQCREIAGKYQTLELREVNKLLSGAHEEKLIALLILVKNFKESNPEGKKIIFNFYLQNTKFINNWDLVDLSADKIVGGFLLDKNRKIIYKLAKSDNLWERRIAIMATFQFIKNQKAFKDTFKIAEILIKDKHDLIQKAAGWMLREVGKRVSEKELTEFLSDHYKKMPRTMLRYSIERFPPEIRKKYLRGEI